GSTGTGTLPPVASPTPLVTPSGSTFVIGTNQGQVPVNNFYENPDYVTTDNQTVVLTENATYTIVYNVSDSSFIISLLSTPLPAARTAAESAFLQQLGITESDACKLNVDEGVPISVSDQYPGEDLGLSFCPGAVGL
ncbi:MAG TPA: hypothetical protein VHZ04_01695, partial [Candidatus Paceibacterota bacterium]|nr:hypothetical protein [Candidatus Paceibacterota bacterium]